MTVERSLLIVTRLGLVFDGKEPESRSALDRRLRILKCVSARFVEVRSDCVGWLIETDVVHYDTIQRAVAEGVVPRPVGGRVVVARRGTNFEQSDVSKLGLEGQSLLTLRLDSDDRYLGEAIDAAVEIAATLPDGVLVDFPHGYLAAPAIERVQRKSYAMQGPFFGITTTGPDLDGIHGQHMRARERRTVEVISQPAWVQTVHGGNFFTEMDLSSAPRRLRQLRRDWIRRAAGRRWNDAPRYLRTLLPPRSKLSRSVLNSLDLEQWP